MRDLDPVSIRLFLATLEEGRIARAAARENIVPSAVSKRISKMESELRMPLLDRSVKGVHPPPPPCARAAAGHGPHAARDGRLCRRRARPDHELASVTSLSGDLPADIMKFRAERPPDEPMRGGVAAAGIPKTFQAPSLLPA